MGRVYVYVGCTRPVTDGRTGIKVEREGKSDMNSMRKEKRNRTRVVCVKTESGNRKRQGRRTF